MLKNLSESAELQQQFHLFQLQQLDKCLLEPDARQEDPEDEVMEEEPSLLAVEPKLQVLALSPRCWTISSLCHLDDPGRFFPPPLASYLAKFTDFYTK
ncbi:cullin-9-like, partial [Alligator sinensis]